MKALVREAMQQGAVGVSTSLQYAPAPYATTEELIALAAEAAQVRRHLCHPHAQRGRADLAALDEAIRIGREAQIPVEIWHLKAAGKPNWGRMPEIVAKIEAARPRGVDISANTYAYPAWFNRFSAFIPPWAHDGGDAKLIERLKDPGHARAHPQGHGGPRRDDWDNEWQEIPGPEAILICVVQNPELLPLQGKTLAEVAKCVDKDPIDALFDILIEDDAFTAVAVFGMSEPDVAARAAAAVGLDRQRLAGHLARRPARQGASASARLRHLPAHPPQVRPRGAQADAGGRHPQVHRAARAAHAPGRPRRAQGGHVGRCRGLRSRPRSGTSRHSKIPTSSRRGWSTCWSTACR